jgi:hypothetical protein
MDHQAAHHDVVRAVRHVECLGGPVGERAIGLAGQTPGVGDRLGGGIHASRGAAGRHGLGQHTGEVPAAAADVEDPVAWPGAALGGQPGEDTASTAAEEDRAEEVVAVSRSDEHAGRAGVRRAMSK